jgi:hypothetical protein
MSSPPTIIRRDNRDYLPNGSPTNIDADMTESCAYFICFVGIEPGVYRKWYVVIFVKLYEARLTTVAREDVRKSVWLRGDGTWNGGKIPGTEVDCAPKKPGESQEDLESRLSRAYIRFCQKRKIKIDHPDHPEHWFCVLRGRKVGVFFGWCVVSSCWF